MRLKGRLYGICLVRFLVFKIPIVENCLVRFLVFRIPIVENCLVRFLVFRVPIVENCLIRFLVFRVPIVGQNWHISVLNRSVNHHNTQLNAETKKIKLQIAIF